jgi:hypothetical protein
MLRVEFSKCPLRRDETRFIIDVTGSAIQSLEQRDVSAARVDRGIVISKRAFGVTEPGVRFGD